MSKEKQIEEMVARIEIENELCDKPCDLCKMYGKGCMPERMAKKLTAKGYRKASEVAREIFEEVEELLNLQAKIVCETRGKYSETDEAMLSFIAMLDGRIYSLRVIEEHIAELKKKYTKSEDTE